MHYTQQRFNFYFQEKYTKGFNRKMKFFPSFSDITTHLVNGIKLKIQTMPSADKNVKELRLSYSAGRSVSWYNHTGEQFDSFLKSQSYIYHMNQPFCSLTGREVRREGSRRHEGQQNNILPWRRCCRGGAEAWGERRDLKGASQNSGTPSPPGVQECPREDSASRLSLAFCSSFQP